MNHINRMLFIIIPIVVLIIGVNSSVIIKEFYPDVPSVHKYTVRGAETVFDEDRFLYYAGNCNLNNNAVANLPLCCSSNSGFELTDMEWFKVISSCNIEMIHLLKNEHTFIGGFDSAFVESAWLTAITTIEEKNTLVSDLLIEVGLTKQALQAAKVLLLIIVFTILLFVGTLLLLFSRHMFLFIYPIVKALCYYPVGLYKKRFVVEKNKVSTFECIEEKRIVANYQYDEKGLYVTDGFTKIYPIQAQNQPLLPNSSERFEVGVALETTLMCSKMYAAELPPFVGAILAEDTIVGIFSRIRFRGKYAMLTAFHVMHKHRFHTLKLMKNGVAHEIDPSWAPLSYSDTNNYDFIIIEVPIKVWGLLKMKEGKITTQVPKSISINLYGYKDGTVHRASGNMQIAPETTFGVAYTASTLPSWSGTPLLGKNNIIYGIHLAGSSSRNFGKLFPFRDTRESPSYGEMYEWMENDEEDTAEESDEEEPYDRQFPNKKYATYYNDGEQIDLSHNNSVVMIGRNVHIDEAHRKSHWMELVDHPFVMDDQLTRKEWETIETITFCPQCYSLQYMDGKCKKCRIPNFIPQLPTMKTSNNDVIAMANQNVDELQDSILSHAVSSKIPDVKKVLKIIDTLETPFTMPVIDEPQVLFSEELASKLTRRKILTDEHEENNFVKLRFLNQDPSKCLRSFPSNARNVQGTYCTTQGDVNYFWCDLPRQLESCDINEQVETPIIAPDKLDVQLQSFVSECKALPLNAGVPPKGGDQNSYLWPSKGIHIPPVAVQTLRPKVVRTEQSVVVAKVITKQQPLTRSFGTWTEGSQLAKLHPGANTPGSKMRNTGNQQAQQLVVSGSQNLPKKQKFGRNLNQNTPQQRRMHGPPVAQMQSMPVQEYNLQGSTSWQSPMNPAYNAHWPSCVPTMERR